MGEENHALNGKTFCFKDTSAVLYIASREEQTILTRNIIQIAIQILQPMQIYQYATCNVIQD